MQTHYEAMQNIKNIDWTPPQNFDWLIKKRFSIVHYYYLVLKWIDKKKLKGTSRIWNRISVIEDEKKVGTEFLNIVENDRKNHLYQVSFAQLIFASRKLVSHWTSVVFSTYQLIYICVSPLYHHEFMICSMFTLMSTAYLFLET